MSGLRTLTAQGEEGTTQEELQTRSRQNLIHSAAILDGPVEFHVRMGNGRGRGRFSEDRFFVTFNVTFNPSASTRYPHSFNHIQQLLVGRTNVRIIQVKRT